MFFNFFYEILIFYLFCFKVGYHGYDQLGFKIVHGGFSYHGKGKIVKYLSTKSLLKSVLSCNTFKSLLYWLRK